MGDEYRRFSLTSRTLEERERLLAEAFEAGAEGAEEQDELASDSAAARFRACIYARAAEVEQVRRAVIEAVRRAADAGGGDGEGPQLGDSREAMGAQIGAAEAIPEVDWSEEWKRGLGPIVISERLVVRPPFAAYSLRPGQREIVIDPGQAFGTGTHASTHLCLEWIDRLLAEAGGRAQFPRMLDVGTGSGVLALAAVALGARSALGFDLDPIAVEAAREAAAANGLSQLVEFRCVAIEEVDAKPAFALVVANLLKRELLPIAGALAERLSRDGSLILSGLLEEDSDEVAARFEPLGLVEQERRVRDDSVGVWIAPRYVFREG